MNCECVSCVFVPRLSSSVCFSPAHFQTAVDKLRCNCKVDSAITSGFGEVVEGTKREYTSSRDWSWDTCGRAVLKKNEREKFSNVTGESTDAGSKILLAEDP